MKPFLALITPLTFPEDPQPPLNIWGGGNQPFPTPPIVTYPGGTPNPPNIWGPTDPRPSNPIANVPGISNPNPPNWPTPPLGIWGGGNVPMPNPPIANVPPFFNPDLPQKPPEGFPPIPTNPISGLPGPTPPDDSGGWMLVYFPDGNYYQWVKVSDVVESMKKGA